MLSVRETKHSTLYTAIAMMWTFLCQDQHSEAYNQDDCKFNDVSKR